MTAIEQTDQQAQARALLLAQFQDKSNLTALLDSWTAQIQELEAVFFDLLEDRTIDNAVGEQLDVLGRIVGEPRSGKDDDDYRLWIKGRISANTSSGTPEDILNLIDLLVSNTFNINEWFPAAISVVIDDDLTETPSEVASILSDTRASGVRSTLEYTLVDDDFTFTFATGDTAETDSDRGFSNLLGYQDFVRVATSAKILDLNSVAYGNGVWIAVGISDGSDAFILSSSDAVTWVERANPKNIYLYSIAFGDGIFVAVGGATGTDPYIITSTDGQIWTEQIPAISINRDLYGVAYDGSGLWVAVGEDDGAKGLIMTSPDAVNWEQRVPTVSKAVDLRAVAHDGSGLWTIVGDNDGVDSYILTSPDAVTWSEVAPTVPKTDDLRGVAHDGDGLWVAVGRSDGVDAYILSSPDAVTWTEVAPAVPKNVDLLAIAHDGDGLWVATGQGDGVDQYILSSPDGVTWTEQAPAVSLNRDLYGIAYDGQSTWIAVGEDDGLDAQIISSATSGGRFAGTLEA
jgi:hypothetical protein